MYRLSFVASAFDALSAHLESARPSEDGAFLVLQVGRGAEDTRLLVSEVLFPPRDAWEARGNHTLRPSGRWVSAAIGRAIDQRSGLAFVHSHPDENHPPDLSPIDRSTSIEWAQTFAPLLQQPFASLVWTPSGVAGWAFEADAASTPRDVGPIEALGGGAIRLLSRPSNEPRHQELDDRQTRALSALGNRRLRSLRVTVIGAGGTGSPLAEQLVRMGVERLSIVDDDRLDEPSNLRRVVGARHEDLTKRARKADVVARHLKSLELGTLVRSLPTDVRSQAGKAAIIDSDVAFVTTDTHGSRAFVNQVALQYHVPVFDIGLVVGLRQDGRVSGMPAEVRVLLPDAPCLWCQNALDAGRIRAENLPTGERDAQEREGYITGLGPQPSVTPLNYFGAALAIVAMLRAQSGDHLTASSFILDPWEQHALVLTKLINEECICASWRGAADSVAISVPTS